MQDFVKNMAYCLQLILFISLPCSSKSGCLSTSGRRRELTNFSAPKGGTQLFSRLNEASITELIP